MIEKLIEEIIQLKEEKNAVILAHVYQSGEVQDIADYTGDSLEWLLLCSCRNYRSSGMFLPCKKYG